MTALVIIFITSGVAILILLLAKIWEQKYQRTFFILSAISKGDHRLREFSHKAAGFYADSKERMVFFVRKQLPLHSKNVWNKSKTFASIQFEKRMGNIRNSRLLRKSEGLPEFFRNLPNIHRNSEKKEIEENDSINNENKLE